GGSRQIKVGRPSGSRPDLPVVLVFVEDTGGRRFVFRKAILRDAFGLFERFRPRCGRDLLSVSVVVPDAVDHVGHMGAQGRGAIFYAIPIFLSREPPPWDSD